MTKKRTSIAEKYSSAFSGSSVVTPVIKPDRTTSWHLYVIKVNNRDELIKNLKESGIGTSVHFIPIHKHPYYKDRFGYKEEDYPVANRVFTRSLSLPIYPSLKEEELYYIIEKVLEYAK